MKRFLSLSCMVIMLSMLLASSVLATTYQVMYVDTANGGTLNVRSSPSAVNDRNVIGKLSYGSEVQVIQYLSDGIWAKVYPTNWSRSGYVMLEHLSYEDPRGGGGSSGSILDSDSVSRVFSGFEKYSGSFTVYASPDRPSGWVNLRWAPSTKSGVQVMCYNGRALMVLAENDYWYQVEDVKTGYVGYIQKQYTISGGYGSSY